MTKQIEVSEELYNALQSLKSVFSQLSGEEIASDEEVIWILVSGFVESLKGENNMEMMEDKDCECCEDGECKGECDHK